MNDLVRPNIGAEFRRRRLGHFPDAPAYARYRRNYDRAMADLPAPGGVQDVPTGFGTVRVYRFGTDGADAGRPLLLLPGRTASTPMWAPNLAGLTASRRAVYTIDLLGEPGLSVQSEPFASAADQGVWLAELLTGLGLDRTHLLGVSIGGWTAFQLARHAPEKVASLSLLDPACLFGRITWKTVAVSLGSVGPLPESWRLRLLSWISGGADLSGDEPVADLISAGMREFTAFLPPPTYPSDEQVAAVDVPTLAVIAGRSIIHHPGRAAERARRLLARGVVELWPDASHALNGEFPERVSARVLAFIDQLDGDDTGRS
ncbi:alpha/beta fold hydrolase [Microtetraspora fusca]|uniref:alpha/beta fold hydrolase n=1 Tax=Microtetraspora fusca TaxID=1997 RepID=UPI000832F774|nr:alpha/beta hydrolase [Microtetraspora fusca]